MTTLFHSMFLVVGTGGTCTETGPFFPQTSRYMIQSGLGLRSSILLEPDWLLILILILCFIAIIAILLLALYLFRKYGWKKVLYVEPNYRKVATTFAFDDYASKVMSSLCNEMNILFFFFTWEMESFFFYNNERAMRDLYFPHLRP